MYICFILLTKKTNMKNDYFIGFAFNGGGIRGIASTAAIQYFEKQLGCHLSEVADLMGGTSTGGILSCALTIPNDEGKPKFWGRDIALLYHRECKVIFKKTFWQKVKTLNGWSSPSYPLTNMIKVFTNYFGSKRISSSLTNMFTTGRDLYNSENFFFKSSKAKENSYFDFTFVDAMCSTAAAPTYFPPHNFVNKDKEYLIADGGVNSLNNPTMAVISEAIELGYPLDKIIIINIGTGTNQKKLTNKAKRFGKLQWIAPVIDTQMDGASDAIKYYATKILPKENLFIWDFEVSEQYQAMDNYKNVAHVENLGYAAVEKQKDLLGAAVARIKEVRGMK